MSNKEDMIKPIIFLKDGQCPNCGKPLLVHNFDAMTLMLNENGLPVKIIEETERSAGYCPSCRNSCDMVRNGMGFTTIIKNSKNTNIISNEGFKSIKKEKNPFTKNIKNNEET